MVRQSIEMESCDDEVTQDLNGERQVVAVQVVSHNIISDHISWIPPW